MTDRYNFLTVALERDIREDDIQPLLQAIMMLKGVLSLKANVADGNDCMAEERARRELTDKLWQVLYPKKEK